MIDAPSNAVLLANIESIKDVILANHILAKEYQDGNKIEHNAILTQCLKTNGRVTELEKSRAMLYGGLIFVNVIIVPIALAMIMKYINK
jgi:hypothetical protein